MVIDNRVETEDNPIYRVKPRLEVLEMGRPGFCGFGEDGKVQPFLYYRPIGDRSPLMIDYTNNILRVCNVIKIKIP